MRWWRWKRELPLALVVGAQRSGTTWLQQLLSAHPRIAAGYESDLFSKYLKDAWAQWWSEKAARDRTGGTRGLATYVTVEQWAELLAGVARSVFRNLLRAKRGAAIVAEKTPDHGLYLRMIRTFFPQVKVLHVIRDGRDVVASMLAAAETSWGAGWEPNDPEEAAATWVSAVRAARTDAAWTAHHLEIRYESLVAQGPETLDRVFRFLDVPLKPERIREIYDTFRFERLRSDQVPPTEVFTGELRRELFLADERARGRRSADSAPAAEPDEAERMRAALHNPNTFYRRGVVGDWKDSLSAPQLEAVLQVAGPLLAELGYLSDRSDEASVVA